MFSISSLSDLHSSGSFWQLTHACIVQNLAKIFQWSVNKDSGVYFSAFSFFLRFTSLLSMRSGSSNSILQFSSAWPHATLNHTAWGEFSEEKSQNTIPSHYITPHSAINCLPVSACFFSTFQCLHVVDFSVFFRFITCICGRINLKWGNITWSRTLLLVIFI